MPWNGALHILQRGSLGSSLSQRRRWRNRGLFPVNSARHISSASGCFSMGILGLFNGERVCPVGAAGTSGCHSFREEKCEPGVEFLKSLQGIATVEELG